MKRARSREHDPDDDGEDGTSEESSKSAFLPKAVIIILLVEFCERFNFYGVRANLPLFLQEALEYNEAGTTPLIRRFVFFCYITPMLGAMVADSFVGKSLTILYMLLFYLIIGILFAFMTSVAPYSILLLLVLMTISAGGIKPCLQVLGGDQYVQPQDYNKIRHFFCFYYMAINLAAVVAILLAWFVPYEFGLWSTAVMISIAFILFVYGKPSFKRALHKKSIGLKAVGCIFYALYKKHTLKEKRENWLEYASPKYTHQTMDDIRSTMQLLLIFIPMPIFWALYFQQFSVWAEEFRRTNHFWDERLITMTEMELINPLCIVIFAPILQFAIYPLLALGKLMRTPLPRIIAGGIFACIAFIIAGVVATDLDARVWTTLFDQIAPFNENLPSGTGQGRIFLYNNMGCRMQVQLKHKKNARVLVSLTLDEGEWDAKVINCTMDDECKDEMYMERKCDNEKKFNSFAHIPQFPLDTTLACTFDHIYFDWTIKDFDTDIDGFPIVETVVNHVDNKAINEPIIFLHEEIEVVTVNATKIATSRFPHRGTYTIKFNTTNVGTITLKEYSRYLLIMRIDWVNFEAKNFSLITLVSTDVVTITYFTTLIPQYIILALAETMFAINGMQLVYTQSAFSLKSLMQALWLVMIAIGMILEDIIISLVRQFTDDYSTHCYICAGIMFVAVLVLVLVTLKYKYVGCEAFYFPPRRGRHRSDDYDDNDDDDDD